VSFKKIKEKLVSFLKKVTDRASVDLVGAVARWGGPKKKRIDETPWGHDRRYSRMEITSYSPGYKGKREKREEKSAGIRSLKDQYQ